MSDIYLDAEATMTEGQRAEFLRSAAAMFPTLRGARVADILDILTDSDWKCGEMEATYNAHAEWFYGLDVPRVFVALRVAAIMPCDARQMVYWLVGGPCVAPEST